MIKSIFRLFNFKTIFILVLYLIFKNENKSIRAYEIKEESMKPALLPDEYVLSVKLKEAPKRGDIVCFKANWGINNIYLKRIIGLPGESIELNGNEIYIDGVKYYENYILEIHSTIQSKHLCCKLENSQYFVLGDNRETNFDSRRFGPIAKKDLIGPTYQICF